MGKERMNCKECHCVEECAFKKPDVFAIGTNTATKLELEKLAKHLGLEVVNNGHGRHSYKIGGVIPLQGQSSGTPIPTQTLKMIFGQLESVYGIKSQRNGNRHLFCSHQRRQNN